MSPPRRRRPDRPPAAGTRGSGRRPRGAGAAGPPGAAARPRAGAGPDAAAAGDPSRRKAGPGGDGAPPRRHAGARERMVHGLRACEALFARRPEAIVRVYVAAHRKPTFKRLLEYCAERRRGFQVVDESSLDRLAGGIHHEGIVILAREHDRGDASALLAGVRAGTVRGPILYLDGVHNPHNLGSILRTAAHFGAGAVAGADGDLPALSAAAARVAEGGAEVVPLFACADPADTLRALGGAGLRVVTTSSRRGAPVAAANLSRDVVLLLGSEAEGVSARLAALADARVRIPGTGAVQSLSVAVACGILLAESCRDAPQAPVGGAAAARG